MTESEASWKGFLQDEKVAFPDLPEEGGNKKTVFSDQAKGLAPAIDAAYPDKNAVLKFQCCTNILHTSYN